MGLLIRISLFVFISFLNCQLACWGSVDNNSFPEILQTGDGLKKIDFKDKEIFRNITQDWPNPENPNEFVGLQEIKKSKSILLFGETFEGTWRIDPNGINDLMFQNMADRDESYRDIFMEKAKQMWGEPIKQMDRTHTGKEFTEYDFKAQWVFGKTIVEFWFFGDKTSGSRQILTSIYFKSIDTNPLMKVVYLQCSDTVQGFGLGEEVAKPKRMKDEIFIIDYDQKEVLNENRELLGKITSSSDSSTVAQWESQGYSTVLTFDNSYSYTLDSVSKQDPSKMIKIEGDCNKIASEKDRHGPDGSRFWLEYGIVETALMHDRGCGMELLKSPQRDYISNFWWNYIKDKCMQNWKDIVNEVYAGVDMSDLKQKNAADKIAMDKSSQCAQSVIYNNWDRINKTIVNNPETDCKNMQQSLIDKFKSALTGNKT
jgi:hypothetical protein